jgi:hypothetical protein
MSPINFGGQGGQSRYEVSIMKIAIIGLGCVGLVFGALLANFGHAAACIVKGRAFQDRLWVVRVLLLGV